jgi:hypothetical protein
MGPTHSGASTPRWTVIGDSTKEFLLAPSREGSFGLPSPKSRGMGASLTPITTIPLMENAPTAQTMMMVPPWMVAKNLPPFRAMSLIMRGSRCKAVLDNPPLRKG